jgi:hypothetical protein
MQILPKKVNPFISVSQRDPPTPPPGADTEERRDLIKYTKPTVS